eukprot:TRINITY_DN7005_c0_g2_i1.p1 TRINITY_DN7005_c0_g2~~TRINITY_DN7005_c0_g2_i1.p1  ORF type:complete len:703 (-),score=130.48 TRINITY_DN7005_c0_g2_i1:151-2235(-)
MGKKRLIKARHFSLPAHNITFRAEGKRVWTSEDGSMLEPLSGSVAVDIPESHRFDGSRLDAKPSSHQHHYTCRSVIGFAVGSLGVVFGDIGTSPIYTFSSLFPDPTTATEASVLGALSLVIWGLILVVMLKYVVVVLSMDNDGEGGTFALAAKLMSAERLSRKWKVAAQYMGIIGAAFILGDGIITPAISVLSAVEGIATYDQSLTVAILPITCVILIPLFLLQRVGTGRVGVVFGPIMLLWFASIFSIGIYQIVQAPQVLMAFNPRYIVVHFQLNGTAGWLQLGIVVLALTGVEAMYADMSHFGALPIRLAWIFVVFPAVLFNYIGQAALMLRYPAAGTMSFFMSIPPFAFWPMIVISTLATVIASQALITGAFSLMDQAVALRVFPRLQSVHKNDAVRGQVYLPAINYTLMVLCVALVLGFRTSNNLADAYGLAVASIMFLTTIMCTLVMILVTKRPWFVWLPFAVMFLFIDGNLFLADLAKVPTGGWIPLVIGIVVSSVMAIWYRGTKMIDRYLRLHELPMDRIVSYVKDGQFAPLEGCGIFLGSKSDMLPQVLRSFTSRTPVLHREVITCTIVMMKELARVPADQRFMFEVIDQDTCISRCIIFYGFADRKINITEVIDEMRSLGLIRAAADKTSFYVGRRLIRVDVQLSLLHRAFVRVYMMLMSLSGCPLDYFSMPSESTISIGTPAVM